jgi:hypothetical protein
VKQGPDGLDEFTDKIRCAGMEQQHTIRCTACLPGESVTRPSLLPHAPPVGPPDTPLPPPAPAAVHQTHTCCVSLH